MRKCYMCITAVFESNEFSVSRIHPILAFWKFIKSSISARDPFASRFFFFGGGLEMCDSWQA